MLFWYRLAGHLGMSVKRCREEVDAEEYAGWLTYFAVEPFGGHIEDFRAGSIVSAIAASAGQTVEPLKVFGWHDQRAALSAEAQQKRLEAQMLKNGFDVRKKP